MNGTQYAARFFNDFADTFDGLYDGKRGSVMRFIDNRFRSDIAVRFLMTFEALEPLSDKTVVDIGCGSGPYVVEAIRRGAKHVFAVDPAANMLKLLNRRLDAAGFERMCTPVHGSFPDVHLDVCDHAIVMGVMDYTPEPVEFLRALRCVVAESAVISFSSTHWLRTPIRRFRYRRRRCPVFFYTQAGIQDICRAAGFRDARISKIPGAGMDYFVCVKP